MLKIDSVLDFKRVCPGSAFPPHICDLPTRTTGGKGTNHLLSHRGHVAFMHAVVTKFRVRRDRKVFKVPFFQTTLLELSKIKTLLKKQDCINEQAKLINHGQNNKRDQVSTAKHMKHVNHLWPRILHFPLLGHVTVLHFMRFDPCLCHVLRWCAYTLAAVEEDVTRVLLHLVQT